MALLLFILSCTPSLEKQMEDKYVDDHDGLWQQVVRQDGSVKTIQEAGDIRKFNTNANDNVIATKRPEVEKTQDVRETQGVEEQSNVERTVESVDASENENIEVKNEVEPQNIPSETTQKSDLDYFNQDDSKIDANNDSKFFEQEENQQRIYAKRQPVKKEDLISKNENQAGVVLGKEYKREDYEEEIQKREQESQYQINRMKEVAADDVKKHFNKGDTKIFSPSLTKGIFTVRNTNFLTVGEKGDIWLWSTNLANKKLIEVLGTCVDKVDFDHNTLSLFWSCGAKLYTKELLNDKSMQQISKIATRASAFSVYNNASQFLVGGADGKIYRWEGQDGRNITDFTDFERYTAHATVVSAIAFHPAGRVFFSGDWQGRFKAWLSYKEDEFGGEYDENLFGGRFFEDGSVLKDSGRAGGSIEKIVPSPRGDFILLGFQDANIELWKLRSFKKVLDIKASALRLIDVKFYDTSSFVTLTKDNVARLWVFNETQDEMGVERVFKAALYRQALLNSPVLLYVTRDGRILYANSEGILKSVNFDNKPIEQEENPNNNF